jgi:hypothetical protein
MGVPLTVNDGKAFNAENICDTCDVLVTSSRIRSELLCARKTTSSTIDLVDALHTEDVECGAEEKWSVSGGRRSNISVILSKNASNATTFNARSCVFVETAALFTTSPKRRNATTFNATSFVFVETTALFTTSPLTATPPPTTTQPQIPTIDALVVSALLAGATGATHVVRVALSLPMRNADFTSDKQTLFKKALATAAGAGVFEADVTIDKLETINGGRRLLAESIRVGTIIKASNQAAADTMAKTLTQDKINNALSKSGLPAATLLEVAAGTVSGGATVTVTPEKESFEDKVKSEGIGAIIGGVLGGLFSLVTCICLKFRNWISSKCGFSGESDQNREPLAEQKATAEASIVSSTSPNTRSLTANPV